MTGPWFRRPVVSLMLCAFALAVAGCWNPFAPDPTPPDPTPPFEYKPRTSCENVLWNIESAYEDRNIDEYLDCLAEDFTFHLNPDDWQDPQSGLPPYWGKHEEESIHRNMFDEGSDVEGITLTLTFIQSSYDPGEDPQDPMDDRWEYQEGVDLRVRVVGDITYMATADQLFILRIDPDETGPGGETLYEIIEWHDLEPQIARPEVGDACEERISRGRLNAMYRE